jgi:hypothetical protein
MNRKIHKLEASMSETLPDALKGYLLWKKCELDERAKVNILTATRMSWSSSNITWALKGQHAGARRRVDGYQHKRTFQPYNAKATFNVDVDGSLPELSPDVITGEGADEAHICDEGDDDDEEWDLDEGEAAEVLATHIDKTKLNYKQARQALSDNDKSRGFQTSRGKGTASGGGRASGRGGGFRAHIS